MAKIIQKEGEGSPELTPGSYTTVNGIVGMVTLGPDGQIIVVDAANPANIIGHVPPGGNLTQVVTGPPVPTGSTAAGNPSLKPPEKSAFQLPIYPLTYTGAPGTFPSLYTQQQEALAATNPQAGTDFARWHISHGGSGDQTTWQGWGKAPPTSGYPLPPQSGPGPAQQPGPVNLPPPIRPPGPYTPPGGQPPYVPFPPVGNPSIPPQTGGLMHPPQTNPFPPQRSGTPGGGLLPPAPVNPMQRGAPGGQIASAADAVPQRGLLQAQSPQSAMQAPQNMGSAFGDFRYQNPSSPEQQNYNAIASQYGPQAAGAYFNANRNALSPGMGQQAGQDFAQQYVNTFGGGTNFGGPGMGYSGGGMDMNGGFSTGMDPAHAAALGLSKNPLSNLYSIPLQNTAANRFAGTPLAGLLAKGAAAMAAASK